MVRSLAGFSFVFLQWRGREVVAAIILATLIVPLETIAVPLRFIVSKLPWIGLDGIEWTWLNTDRVQILPWIADGLRVILLVQYFKSIAPTG